MAGLVLCAGAFLLCYFAGRRSLAGGLAAVLGVAYFYGILRANVTSTFSYFIFDAGALGLFAAQLLKPLSQEEHVRIQPLLPWLLLLIAWPTLLLLFPVQDPLVQLVGLRAHVFFLPFMLFGARLTRPEMHRLIMWLAALNVVAFGFGVAEFFLGVERFFPRSAVTELIYRSRDVGTVGLMGAFRIPSIFANAGLYGGAMVMTIPLLLGLWVQKGLLGQGERILLTAATMASVLGVFMSATRMHFLVLMVLLGVALISGRLGKAGLAAWVVLLGGVGWLISLDQRLFLRIMSLNLDTIVERLSWSINESLIALLFEYPLGNGLGGGGSNIPAFLHHLIRNPVAIENHYATILLEQGLPGLLLWFGFIAWVLTRRTTPSADGWQFGRRLLWLCVAAYFAQGVIGIGLLSALPFSILLLISVGWLSVPQPSAVPEKARRTVPEAEVRAAPVERVAW